MSQEVVEWAGGFVSGSTLLIRKFVIGDSSVSCILICTCVHPLIILSCSKHGQELANLLALVRSIVASLKISRHDVQSVSHRLTDSQTGPLLRPRCPCAAAVAG